MPVRLTLLTILPALFAVYMPMCGPPEVRPTVPASEAPLVELWQRPDDLADRDLFYGPWGREHAPDPQATYTFVKPKRTGMNPGMTVVDSRGREWDVKQAPHDENLPEGPIEVVMSRVLSAVGYHQPPLYLLPSFTLADAFGTRVEPGGRFRLDHPSLKEEGQWSWQQNPFVGTRPYQGLLVILLMFNSSDLKNENNSLYEVVDSPADVKRWFVVRDLGISLGGTGRVLPPRGDPSLFEQHGFITGVEDGFVTFEYHGFHEELIRRRITPGDVRWACELLGRLSERQWRDGFRAGGYDTPTSERFIKRLREKIQQGMALSRT
jgi:hypothetical protein